MATSSRLIGKLPSPDGLPACWPIGWSRQGEAPWDYRPDLCQAATCVVNDRFQKDASTDKCSRTTRWIRCLLSARDGDSDTSSLTGRTDHSLGAVLAAAVRSIHDSDDSRPRSAPTGSGKLLRPTRSRQDEASFLRRRVTLLMVVALNECHEEFKGDEVDGIDAERLLDGSESVCRRSLGCCTTRLRYP